MAVSIFDLLKIGIGPSSSHTVGPMRAAARFVDHQLVQKGLLDQVARVHAELFGSLALTGRGHGTDKAVLLGLEGHEPDTIDPDAIESILARIRTDKRLRLGGAHEIAFDEKRDLKFNKRQKLPYHVNGMRFTAFDAEGAELATRDYYSVGGGFVVNPDEAAADRIVADTTRVRYPFTTGDELLGTCERENLRIAEVMLANEKAWRSEADIRDGLLTIWRAMRDCVTRGLRSDGELPGGLRVKRRGPKLAAELRNKP
jgi:L-serine dehydratase